MTAAAYWGEQPTGAIAKASRGTGFEPDTATLSFYEDQFVKWAASLSTKDLQGGAIEPISPLAAALKAVEAFRDRSGGQAVPTTNDPNPTSPQPVVADLQFVEEFGGGVAPGGIGGGGIGFGAPGNFRAVYAGMFLSGVRVVDDVSPRKIEITLVDARKFWMTHGTVTKNYNVKHADGSYDLASLKKTGDTYKAWSLRELFEDLVPRLPGVLGGKGLINFPPVTRAEVREIRAHGARPAEILKELVEESSMVFVFNLDSSVSVFREGAGKVGTQSTHSQDVILEHDPATGKGEWEGDIHENLYLRRPNLRRPNEVEVVVRPRIWTAAIDYWQPVLILPDGAVVDVTPDSLRRIGAGLSPISDPDDDPDFVGPELVDTIDLKQFMRIPFLGATWPRELERIPQDMRDTLRRQLFRIYRCPDQFTYLLPLLDRAEFDRAKNGIPSRRKISAETFRFNATGIKSTAAALSADILAYNAKASRLAQIDNELQQLEDIDGTDILGFAQGLVLGDVTVDASFAVNKERWTLDVALPDVKVEAGFADTTSDDIADYFLDMGRSLLFKVTGQEANQVVPIADQRKALKKEKVQVTKEIDKLLIKVDPQRAFQRKLAALGKQITTLRRRGRPVPVAIKIEVINTREQLKAVLVAGKEHVNFTLPEKKLLHANRGRDTVAVTVISAGSGIVEVLGPLPGWLVNPYVPTLSASFFFPMPVRVSFGTTVPPRESGTHWEDGEPIDAGAKIAIDDNQWTLAAVESFREGSDEMKALATNLGHIYPSAAGLPPSLKFKRGNDSGDATVGEFPLSIVLDGMQEFVGLPTVDEPDGLSNTKEVLGRSRDLANALLNAPPTLEAGTLEIYHPRNVNPNGRVSAVRHFMTAGGAGINTIISFDDATAPLPGMAKLRRMAGNLKVYFGIDTRIQI